MFLDFHTHRRSSCAEVLSILNVRYPDAFVDEGPVSLGIHPWDALAPEIGDAREMESRALGDQVKMIGEAGLDVLRGGKYQEQLFLQQISLSERCRKPMVIHCVKAYNEVIAIRRLLRPHQAWAIHGFNRRAEMAQELIKRGFYLSFGQALLESKTVQEAFLLCPLERVFLETDDAGALKIQEVYARAAELKGLNIETLKLEILKNFYERFVMAVPV